jgi:MtrB/PioB family decaheme-associated outer membrane protein
MRTRTLILIGALLPASQGLAQAQQEPQATPQTTASAPAPTTTFSPTIGRVDFGFRGQSLSGDAARFNRLRDRREGALVDAFRLEKETATWFFRAEADRVGYRDQRYRADFQSIGKLKVSFEWDQIPLLQSLTTRSLYTDMGGGVLAVDDAIQQGIQAGTLTLANALTQAKQFDLRSRRDVGAFNLAYAVNRSVDLKFAVKHTERNGHNLMSFGFGTNPGLNPSVEMGAPVDDRTTDIKGGVVFANTKGLLSLGYNGSWYHNNVPTVRFDNPLRFTAISGGASVGQAVLWPTNSSVSVNVNGSYKLQPRTRASAFISIGRWSQDEPLAPPTVNTALVAPPLERASAETSADIVSMVYSLTSRPVEDLWLSARYRYYDYANQTPIFDTTTLIGDWAVGTAVWENEPASIKRQTLDLDASFSPHRYVGLGVGYAREDADRTFRIFEKTAEDVLRFSIDSTGNQYVTLRAKYEFSRREEVGEQPTMRHFDIASRDRSRVIGQVTVTPIAQLAINASVGDGHDDFKDSGFGLRDNKNRTYGVGFDAVPVDAVSFGLSYGYEKYTALQYSRNISASPTSPAGQAQWIDPRRDWWTDQNDTVKTVTAYLDLIKALPKTDIRVGYDLSDGKATYVYNLNPDQTLFTTTPLAQLAPLKNKLSAAQLDLQHFVRENVALGVTYWYEEYRVHDFSLNDTTINQLNLPSTIYTGYLYRPYTAHTFALRMSYLW